MILVRRSMWNLEKGQGPVNIRVMMSYSLIKLCYIISLIGDATQCKS